MTNPHLLKTAVKREHDPRFAGGKYYLPVLHGHGYARAARRLFKRASEAESYASRLRDRWVRLYDAAVAAMLEPTA